MPGTSPRRPISGQQHSAPSRRPAIGWREWVALPSLNVARIKAKVDTGARTSALHAFNLKTFTRDEQLWVRFEAHPAQRSKRQIVRCEAPVKDHRTITNSGGGREKRYVIETILQIGEIAWSIDVTLTDRDQMGFRMLLGRSAIRRRFVVDPARSYCRSSKNP